MAKTSDSTIKRPLAEIPCDINAEKALLGSILISGKSAYNLIDQIGDKLREDYFFDIRNQKVYSTIVSLWLNQQPIDTIHCLDRLKKTQSDYKNEYNGAEFEQVDKEYLDELLVHSSLLSNPIETAKLIKEKFILRGIISAGEELKHLAFKQDKDPEAILDIAQQNLFKLTIGNQDKNFVKLGEIAHETMEKMDLIHNNPEEYNGVKTGFYDLDYKLGGLHNSDLIILACRPSMGKTALSLALALKVAKQGVGVAYFSLEMSADQLCERLIAAESKIDFRKIRAGELDTDAQNKEYEKMGKAVGRIAELPIWVDDTAAATVLEIRSKARRLKQRQNIGLIVIDYLQLMGGGNDKVYAGNRVQEVSDISRNLKILAKDLNVPIIALSQLSRKVESRDDKRPMLSDLRESGCLTGDTLVQILDHGHVSIKELLSDFQNKQILALNQAGDLNHGKLGYFPISNVFSTGIKQTFELQLASGKTIKATANHQFLTQDGWKRLDKLSTNERIATPEYLINQNRDNLNILDNELILLAHLLGDGCILPKQPYHYTNSDSQNLDIVEETAKELFDITPRRVDYVTYQHVYLPSPYRLTHGKYHPITNWFKKLGLELSHSYNKILPEICFTFSERQISLFLHHLWATDGNISISINNNRGTPVVSIYYASTSLHLIKQVQELLLKLQIQSTIRTIKKGSYRNCYHLAIQSSYSQELFLKLINSYGKRGSIKTKCLEILGNQSAKNPNNNVFDKQIWKQINEIRKKKNITHRELCRLIDTQYCGSSLYKSGLSKIRLLKIAKALNSSELESMATSDIYWDKIKSITLASIEEVYDITVLNHHNFIANNIVVHNSIEQDADIVLFIHREDYYNKNLINEKPEQANKAEIIVAKNRNGETGFAELAWIRHLATFDNLENAKKGGNRFK
jgi:replicative DNA helicase